MSDEPRPDETPASPSPAETASPAPVTGPQIPDPKSQTPSAGSARPPIDYAMPAPKSFIPTPGLIRNLGCLFKLIVGFTFLICLGYFALVALNPKARQWALQGSKPGPGGAPPSGKGPTPFKALNQILAIPAQAMGKTDDVVKANNARVGQLDGVIAEEEGKNKGKGSRSGRPVVDPFASPAAASGKDAARAAGAAEANADTGPQGVSGSHLLALAEKNATTTPQASDLTPQASEAKASPPRASAQGGAPEGPDQMKLPGDIVIAQASPAGTPRASAAFFYWVVKLNVGGITQGKPARLLINNRLAHEGDEVNRSLGIIFVQLDAANKQLIFRDSSGAIVTRSY